MHAAACTGKVLASAMNNIETEPLKRERERERES